MKWYEILILIVSILIIIIFVLAFITYKIVFYNKNDKDDVYALQVKLNEKDKQRMISLIQLLIISIHRKISQEESL